MMDGCVGRKIGSIAAAAFALRMAMACGSSTEERGPPAAPEPSSSSGFSGNTSSSGGVGGDAATECVAKEADVEPGTRPVDIVFVIDNSTSMSEEIAQVEEQINANFASIIAASGIDYRVVMLSRHGASSSQRVCVRAPLSGTSCAPIPATPVESARFFHHNSEITSTDTFCRILVTFNSPDLDGAHPQGWGALLRPNAFKVFSVITDDHVDTACNGLTYDDGSVDPVSGATAAGTFESALFALSPQFGTAAKRNYVWHSIVGLAPFDSNDLTKPHPATAPVVSTVCTPGSLSPGTGYQALSVLTGGLRYPTCGLDYTTIFQAMAKEVVDTAIVSCEFSVPEAPTGENIDLGATIARYTAGNGTVSDLQQVAGAGACGPGKFYLEDLTIKLCPEACAVVQGDPKAQLKVIFGCKPRTN